ncbi:phage holin family protein [Pistricoccus aurantiacus]|uniref:Phage holin family protein n=1 Tax=Pistricoccus aurantiacus TaxID=1883414 RepID=A0A5B8SS53_9GAMM|nr:phage holin family protein [Pistricoccus aurantiacus]QEA39486.1 hypothetical protein FGL86_10630 [Pistricoccus aurantiacus]
MSTGQGPAERVFDATKRLISSLIQSGETRLRLAVVELEEERSRLFLLLLLTCFSLILMLLGMMLLTLLIVVLFWDSHRIAAIVTCIVLLLGGGLGLASWVVYKARQRTLLKSTLRQLKADRRLLGNQREL